MTSTGESPPEGARVLEALTVEEINALLPRHGVGRVVFVDIRGPVALPVNYVRDHDDFVFRTESWSSILSASSAGRVSFEVDEIDEQQQLGWSVLATGSVHRVEDPADVQHVSMLRASPWAKGSKGPRDRHLRLVVEQITGRRLAVDDEPVTRDPHPG